MKFCAVLLLFCVVKCYSSLCVCLSQEADGDLRQAVCFLTERHAKELGQEAAAAEPSDSEGSAIDAEQAASEHFCLNF